MSNLNRKIQSSESLVDVLVESSTKETDSDHSKKMTVADQKELVLQSAEAVGITISPTQIKALLKGMDKESKSNRAHFYEAVQKALSLYKDHIASEDKKMMQAIVSNFTEATNQADKNFVDDVAASFRKIQEHSADSARISENSFAEIYSAIEDGSLFDF